MWYHDNTTNTMLYIYQDSVPLYSYSTLEYYNIYELQLSQNVPTKKKKKKVQIQWTHWLTADQNNMSTPWAHSNGN